jgi:hypothetical protein
MSHDDAYSKQEHELIPGFLRGYRAWDWRPPVLRGKVRMFDWHSGRNQAQCIGGVHHSRQTLTVSDERPQVPLRDCSCGFYATHQGFPANYAGALEGSIKAEGRIILGEVGFRAQYATVEALCIGKWTGLGLGLGFAGHTHKGVEEYYGVPLFGSREELLREFPPHDISNLITLPPPLPPILLLRNLPTDGRSLIITNYMDGMSIICFHGKVRVTRKDVTRTDIERLYIGSNDQWQELYRQALTTPGCEFDEGSFGW